MIEVYCDESRPEVIFGENSKDRYMVLGGLWVPYDLREDLKNSIKDIKRKHNVYGEFKWNTVSPSKINFYKDLIDIFFSSSVRFRCIVVDSIFVNVPKYHNSDSELGFYKFYYQLLVHWLNPRETYWIYLDHKKNKMSDRLHTLEDVLLNSVNVKIGDVQAIDSKQSILIQFADVLIGAVGYKYHRLDSSEAKLSVIKYIEEKLGSEIYATPKSERKFNVFKINLRGQ